MLLIFKNEILFRNLKTRRSAVRSYINMEESDKTKLLSCNPIQPRMSKQLSLKRKQTFSTAPKMKQKKMQPMGDTTNVTMKHRSCTSSQTAQGNFPATQQLSYLALPKNIFHSTCEHRDTGEFIIFNRSDASKYRFTTFNTNTAL